MSSQKTNPITQWVERFSTFMNRSARLGPYAKATRSLHKDEIAEAMADITWQTKCRIYNQQTSCNHRKGGKYRHGLQHRDHAVTTHIFIDSRTRIKCVLCGLEAWSKSGENFKFAYLQSLAEKSTNRYSASEQVLLKVTQGQVELATFPDTDAGRAALRKKFPGWNGKVRPYGLMDVTKEDNGLGIPEGHSPIKGVEASTPEAGPDSPNAIIVSAHDDLLYSGEDISETK